MCGRFNDASVYNRSTLAEIIRDPIYSRYQLRIGRTNVYPHLIGDSAFPLPQHLMKPYPEREFMPQNQSLFNYRLSHCRCTVERAFGHIKNRFHLLH